VDSTLREILASVHAAGLDGRTALIVSSDHPFRASTLNDLHVPFIVHLPGEEIETVWPKEFSAIASKSLALAIQTGEVKSAGDVVKFLQHDRG
jgi:hypothetical protein